MKIFKNEKTNKIAGKIGSVFAVVAFFFGIELYESKTLHHCKLEILVAGKPGGNIYKEDLLSAQKIDAHCASNERSIWIVEKFSTTIVAPDKTQQTYYLDNEVFSPEMKNDLNNIRAGSNVLFNDIILFNQNGDTVQYDLAFLVE